jgi:alpha-L-rhamnosidase
MTTAYPELVHGRGKGGDPADHLRRGPRGRKGSQGQPHETANRSILGLRDTYVCDGGPHRAWSTALVARVALHPGGRPDRGRGPDTRVDWGPFYTGYPFRERAGVEASDPVIARIWETGTRTARMNAHETYMDCPYWEQLQYIGDTRIQALISYVEFGDDRLARPGAGRLRLVEDQPRA